MKNVGKFAWKFAKNMLGSVTCVTLIGLVGYYLSKGLHWISGEILEFLAKAANYLVGNWVAVIVVVITITLGSLIFEAFVNHLKNRKAQKAQN